MQLSNYHSHCTFCDGRSIPEDFVRFAITHGFRAYGFSSHSPLPFETFWNMSKDDMPEYLQEINRLKQKYSDQLDELDEKILKLIIGNARMPFLEVARECNVSGAAIHQRIQKLTNLGVIKGSEFIVDNTKVGYETCAYMGLFLKSPGQFPSVTEALLQIPEVVECHYTTGQYDLFIKIYAKNNQHLLSIIHNKLQPLGLARTESLISFKEAFKRQIPIDLDDD